MIINKNRPIVVQDKLEAAKVIEQPSGKAEAIKYIRCAIDALANCSNIKEDVVCQESIANLSVVLFDLQ